MFEFSVNPRIKPANELYPMKEANRAVESVREDRLHYRAVLINEH